MPGGLLNAAAFGKHRFACQACGPLDDLADGDVGEKAPAGHAAAWATSERRLQSTSNPNTMHRPRERVTSGFSRLAHETHASYSSSSGAHISGERESPGWRPASPGLLLMAPSMQKKNPTGALRGRVPLPAVGGHWAGPRGRQVRSACHGWPARVLNPGQSANRRSIGNLEP